MRLWGTLEPVMPRPRRFTGPSPTEIGRSDGLAYSLWLPPPGVPRCGGVVILHGAGSQKESHHDFARALLPLGHAAIAYDARGHGDSEGPMDARTIEDVANIADVLRTALGDDDAPIGLRGSSMGGFTALLAAPLVRASAVVAICPASAAGLIRGLRAGRFELNADVEALTGLLEEVDLNATVESLTMPLLLMHAEGDEQVPVAHSRELAARAGTEIARLVVVPGGHHRSIQHDEDLQALSLRFLGRHLGRGPS
jgi:alpha-beta hydrolase superfamily lysophospholipase